MYLRRHESLYIEQRKGPYSDKLLVIMLLMQTIAIYRTAMLDKQVGRRYFLNRGFFQVFTIRSYYSKVVR